ncbi:LytTR family DNA-binding domain-containing protein [Bacteroidales bacterium OttesenSCG-928-M06]|nr:LytTR family DNA-binding domain-containing protein [Bacteroidales bacterium OttesenSCG-928-M06]
MIRCIAIDDEPLALFQICKYIEKTPSLELVQGFSSALDALDFLSQQSIDLAFVDINMPDLSGLDFVKSLKQKPLIIFTTAYSEYALEGFKVDALDYLLKPIGYNDFLKSANKALYQYELLNKDSRTEQDFIFIKADHKMFKIYVLDILYIESRGEYIRIYRKNDKPLMTLLSLKSMEEKLAKDRFMRIHRSYLINLKEIISIEKGRVILNGDISIPVGEQYRADFINYVEGYLL